MCWWDMKRKFRNILLGDDYDYYYLQISENKDQATLAVLWTLRANNKTVENSAFIERCYVCVLICATVKKLYDEHDTASV